MTGAGVGSEAQQQLDLLGRVQTVQLPPPERTQPGCGDLVVCGDEQRADDGDRDVAARRRLPGAAPADQRLAGDQPLVESPAGFSVRACSATVDSATPRPQPLGQRGAQHRRAAASGRRSASAVKLMRRAAWR